MEPQQRRMRRGAPAGGPRDWEQGLARLILRLGHGRRRKATRLDTSGLLRIFRFAEVLASLGHAKRPLGPEGVLCYELAPYRGDPLPLPGQAPLARGERVVVLHWNGGRFSELTADFSGSRALSLRAWRIVAAGLHALSRLAASGALPPDVRAVWAETVLYAVLQRFGFSIRPAAAGPRTTFVRLYLLGLMAIYGHEGVARATGSRQDRYRLGVAWAPIDGLSERLQHGRSADAVSEALTPRPEREQGAGGEGGLECEAADRRPRAERAVATARSRGSRSRGRRQR